MNNYETALSVLTAQISKNVTTLFNGHIRNKHILDIVVKAPGYGKTTSYFCKSGWKSKCEHGHWDYNITFSKSGFGKQNITHKLATATGVFVKCRDYMDIRAWLTILFHKEVDAIRPWLGTLQKRNKTLPAFYDQVVDILNPYFALGRDIKQVQNVEKSVANGFLPLLTLHNI